VVSAILHPSSKFKCSKFRLRILRKFCEKHRRKLKYLLFSSNITNSITCNNITWCQIKQQQEEIKQKLLDEVEPQTLQQQENISIKGQSARHLVMQKLMRKADVSISYSTNNMYIRLLMNIVNSGLLISLESSYFVTWLVQKMLTKLFKRKSPTSVQSNSRHDTLINGKF